jgi:peptidoglycan/xylan/chitin deacetylase (PgdA/CDA1 family)
MRVEAEAMISQLAKRLGVAIGTALVIPPLTRSLLRNHGLIFMLHRFHLPDLGVDGHDPAALRTSLAYLRRRRYELVSLEELLRRLSSGPSRARGAIAFTIDDGYFDQAAIAGPAFAEFDCPVTTFVTTGFLDRMLWFWWDRIAYVFNHTRARAVRAPLGEQTLEYRWNSPRECKQAVFDFTHRCKEVPDQVKNRAILDLATEAGVALPSAAPPEFAPMTWDDLRACERRGMSFGPHTVTHPVLARTPDRQSEAEIMESWERLKAEAAAPVGVFCYPNGQPRDFGEREYATLARVGIIGSVVGTPGYAHRGAFVNGGSGRFQIPRYHWPDELTLVRRYATGFERMRQVVFGGA